MVHRRFPRLPVFHRPRADQDVRQASSEDIAAAGWADTFRAEHADLVGELPLARPPRHRWLAAASVLTLAVLAVALHGDPRHAGSGAQRGADAEQRRTAIAEAVSQELARTREAFEAYRVGATRDLSAVRDSLASRETSLHQAERARQAADDLAVERARIVAATASDLAAARRDLAMAQTAITEARMAAHEAAQAARASSARAEAAAIEAVPRTPSADPMATSVPRDGPVQTKAAGRPEPAGMPGTQAEVLAAGEGPRFGRSDMAWLPLAETAFMALDAGHVRTGAPPVAVDGGGTSCLDGLPALLRTTSPTATGKAARSTRTDARKAGSSRTRQRTDGTTRPLQVGGAGAQLGRSPQIGASLRTGGRPASLPDRS